MAFPCFLIWWAHDFCTLRLFWWIIIYFKNKERLHKAWKLLFEIITNIQLVGAFSNEGSNSHHAQICLRIRKILNKNYPFVSIWMAWWICASGINASEYLGCFQLWTVRLLIRLILWTDWTETQGVQYRKSNLKEINNFTTLWYTLVLNIDPFPTNYRH